LADLAVTAQYRLSSTNLPTAHASARSLAGLGPEPGHPGDLVKNRNAMPTQGLVPALHIAHDKHLQSNGQYSTRITKEKNRHLLPYLSSKATQKGKDSLLK